MVTVAGNRCGHDPAARAGSNRRPSTPPGPRSSCNSRNGSGLLRRPKVLPSLNAANGSPRQQRSERREACLDLLGALVHYLDLATCGWGYPGRRLDPRISLAFLAEKPVSADAGPNGPAAICAAPGWSPSTPRPKTEDGPLQGQRPFAACPKPCSQVFGLSKWLQHERDKAVKRRRRHRRRQETAATAADQGRREPELKPGSARNRRPTGTRRNGGDDTARRDTAHAALGALLGSCEGDRPD